ncbi:MAG TPA: stage III sporulation protein AD [Firmicutes bacterium]|nr:stage III sporulation protein AD [Bacillota bacterium]
MLLWLPFVIGMGLVLTVFQAHFREEKPEWAVLLAAAFVITVFLGLIPHLSSAVDAFADLAKQASVHSLYLSPVIKTIGVAYLTSFGAHLSKEAGEESISAMMELGGKLVILFIALPVLQAILNALFGILSY